MRVRHLQLLIEPEGIEIFLRSFVCSKIVLLLIEPEGIEMWLNVIIVLLRIMLLIEPEGIEIKVSGVTFGMEQDF